MHNLTNSEIKQLVERHFKTETDRNVIIDRFINGMTYDEIVSKHYPEMEDQSEKVVKSFITKKIKPLCNQFDNVIASAK